MPKNVSKASTYDLMRPKGTYDAILQQRELDGFRFYKEYHTKFVKTNCPACGSKGSYIYSKYDFSHDYCAQCKTVYCSPRPSEDLLGVYYNEFEAPKAWTQLLLTTDADRKALQYQPRTQRISDFLRQQGRASLKTAVDVGCGSGAFLKALTQSGYFEKVIGLDFSQDCVRVCKERNLDARVGTLQGLEPHSVDIIFVNDLIEHLFDPSKFLQECRQALRPDGYISIACPNGAGYDFQILKEQTQNISPPDHLNYFNPESLSLLLEKQGYFPLLVETPGKLDVDIIAKQREAGFDLSTNNEFLEFLYSKNNPELLKNFQSFLAANQLSSHMLILAQVSKAL